MRLVHVGPFKIGTIHGTFNALWTLARSQAKRGHDVTIVRAGKSATSEQVELAAAEGVRLLGWPHNERLFWRDGHHRFARLLDELNPDLVHLQYVRMPKYLIASKLLTARRIPFVISLHGGMNSREMTRKRLRKLVYWYLVERRIHARASGLHFVSKKEMDDYERRWKIRSPIGSAVANPSELAFDVPLWTGVEDPAAPKIAYFGRYDPWHKGIDLAAELVRKLNRSGISAGLLLYGSIDLFQEEMRALMQEYDDIAITDHGFLMGKEMYEAMRSCDLYIQYSRFEAFGMSLVEAMGLGVPAIVSENCDLAPEISATDAAIVVPMDPSRAAEIVANALSRPRELVGLGLRGRQWALHTCDPQRVEVLMNDFYEQAIRAEGNKTLAHWPPHG